MNLATAQDKMPIIFLYTSKEQLENKNFKILFTIASKRIKYLEINLTKHLQTCALKTIIIPKRN